MDEEINTLRKQNIKSKVYFTFFYPRTQTEAVEYIYERKPQTVNIKPIIAAREWLEERNYVTYANKPLRNRKITSTLLPIQLAIKEDFIKREEESKHPDTWDIKGFAEKYVFPTEGKVTVFEKIFSSEWFRNTFFSKVAVGIGGPNFRYTAYKEREGKLRENGKLIVDGGITAVFAKIKDVIDIVHTMHGYVKDYYPKAKDIEKFDTFEAFGDYWYEKNKNKIDENKIKGLFDARDKNSWSNQLIMECLKGPPYYGLCIPYNFFKLIERVYFSPRSHSISLGIRAKNIF
jgi:hypothetical protein